MLQEWPQILSTLPTGEFESKSSHFAPGQALGPLDEYIVVEVILCQFLDQT